MILLFYFVMFLRYLCFPVTILFAPWFSPYLFKRRGFEWGNFSSKYSETFRQDNQRADFTFEVSSEGELEQIRPLLDSLLEAKLSIELIYSSESVEKKALKLAEQHYPKLRIYRLPLITAFPFNILGGQSIFRWVTSRTIILCRYDFYPELMLLGIRRRFVLLSATLKNKEEILKKKNLCSFYYRFVYRLFHYVVTATNADLLRFTRLGIRREALNSFDFRVIQIARRIDQREKIFAKYHDWIHYLEKFRREDRVIFGSFWASEANVFLNRFFLQEIIEGKLQVTLAPHKLGNAFIEEIKSVIQKVAIDLPIYVLSSQMSEEESRHLFKEIQKRPGVLIVTIPGLLCELYSYFGHAFVGGGHGRSIHSVLEPYLAHSLVYCGPKTFRSTEFDFISENSPAKNWVVEELKDFYTIFNRNRNVEVDFERRKKLVIEHNQEYGRILKRLMELHPHVE